MEINSKVWDLKSSIGSVVGEKSPVQSKCFEIGFKQHLWAESGFRLPNAVGVVYLYLIVV